MSESIDIQEVSRVDEAGLALARRLKQRLRCTVEAAKSSPEDATYLWLFVSKAGDAAAERPPVESWLNAIDEAASLGVNWLVVSVEDRIERHPEVWAICDWAQRSHGMMVGVHTNATDVTPAERAGFSKLKRNLLRVLAPKASLPGLAVLEGDGIKVCPSDPEHDDTFKPCRKPGKMLYVNPLGQLYTCGMVDGTSGYHLGNVHEHSFRQVVSDPARPHAVPAEHAQRHRGCDGCPPLVIKYFQ